MVSAVCLSIFLQKRKGRQGDCPGRHSMVTLKLAFNVSSDDQGSHHDDLFVSVVYQLALIHDGPTYWPMFMLFFANIGLLM